MVEFGGGGGVGGIIVFGNMLDILCEKKLVEYLQINLLKRKKKFFLLFFLFFIYRIACNHAAATGKSDNSSTHGN